MRAVGYSPEAAIADLVDNSVSARATEISIRYDAVDKPFVAILDNGSGMTGPELTNAMRHGSRNPTIQRDEHDLGRFGLGLKTASLSQCRKLTVVSKKNGTISARCWDLEVVRQKERWVVVVPGESDCAKLPLFAAIEGLTSGTLVVWEELDKLTAGASDAAAEMTYKLSSLRNHLALVFHRFTSKEDGFQAVKMTINGLKLPAIDPFLKKNPYRQPLETQTIRHERGVAHVVPYILPPVHRLSREEIELAGGRDGLRSSQGFYIYRNRRLVIWGTWFKLVPKEEFFKLARVQVDIPNTFDDLWSLDIKKSGAFPPEVIRQRLKELLPHFAGTCKRTITYLGRTSHKSDFTPLWVRTEPEHGKFRYEINTDFPIIQKLVSRLDKDSIKHLDLILDLASELLPLEAIYADMCGDSRRGPEVPDFDELLAKARLISELTGAAPTDVLNIDPFAKFPQIHERLKAALLNAN